METVENKYITVAYKLYAIEDGEKDFTEEATVSVCTSDSEIKLIACFQIFHLIFERL